MCKALSNWKLFVILFAHFWVGASSIDTELLKPCFERYDGYKLFGAAPIHSEWRMQDEQQCLPFCIRAASRCSSIVYDKQERTCYYFSINGIELESIERNARMVYLQVAERRCVDEMLMVMESENSLTQQVSVSSPGTEQRYIIQRYPTHKSSNPQKISYGKVKTEIKMPLEAVKTATTTTVVEPETTTNELESISNEAAVAETTKTTDETTTQTIDVAEVIVQAKRIAETVKPTVVVVHATTTSGSREIQGGSNADKIEGESNADKVYDDFYASLYGTTTAAQTIKSTPILLPETVAPVMVDSELMNHSPSEGASLKSKLSKYGTKEKLNKNATYLDANIENTTTKHPQPMSAEVKAAENMVGGPLSTLDFAVDSIPSFLPVMSLFKAQRRPASDSAVLEQIASSAKEEEEILNERHSNDIRRHPQSDSRTNAAEPKLELPTMVLPTKPPTTVAAVVEKQLSLAEENLNRDDSVERQHVVKHDESYAANPIFERLDSEVAERRTIVPHVERLPASGLAAESDDVIDAADDDKSQPNDEADVEKANLEESGCVASNKNEIWLAVESAKLKSALRPQNRNYLALQQPKDCMMDCSSGAGLLSARGRRRRCDAFTYLEASKQCVFDVVGKHFIEKMAAPRVPADFSTRAFHRLCFASNVARFRGCTEFLAFRNFALNIPAREFFNGLPGGTEGIAACVELCVLSSDFQCRSALFDSESGACQLFDEHSLSAPLAFREHARTGQLYFENGCLDGGELPQEWSLGSSLQKSQSERPPTRIDYAEVSRRRS